MSNNPYENMTTVQALRHLAKRYLRKPECIQLVEQAALEIEAYQKVQREDQKQ